MLILSEIAQRYLCFRGYQDEAQLFGESPKRSGISHMRGFSYAKSQDYHQKQQI